MISLGAFVGTRNERAKPEGEILGTAGATRPASAAALASAARAASEAAMAGAIGTNYRSGGNAVRVARLPRRAERRRGRTDLRLGAVHVYVLER